MSKTKRVVANKQKMVSVSYHRQTYIPQAPGLRNVSYQETGSSAKWSSFLLEWKKKRREMPPWIDEWQMSHFHLWGSECSHSSAVMSRHDWNVFFCMSLCEINKSERKEKRGWECNDEILAAIFFYPSNVPLNGPMPSPFIQPESQLFHPALQHGRCVSWKKQTR